jgi:hypothetical protein
MHDARAFEAALALLRAPLLDAVRDWRALGGRDEDLALFVDGERNNPARIAPQTRAHLMRTLADFEPTIAIELTKHKLGQAPAVVTLPAVVHAIYWIDLATGAATAAY